MSVEVPFQHSKKNKGYTTAAIEQFVNVQKLISVATVCYIDCYEVKLTSVRVQTFRDSSTCSHPGCTKTVKIAAAQLHTRKGQTKIGRSDCHVNFWGVDDCGNWDLMTCDHKVARCLGGEDSAANTQVLCSYHNSLKSKLEQQLKISKEQNGKLQSNNDAWG